MKHKNIRHIIIVNKEMMIKSIADLMFNNSIYGPEERHHVEITKLNIRKHISWTTWYCGTSGIEDQPDDVKKFYPKATRLYLKMYP